MKRFYPITWTTISNVGFAVAFIATIVFCSIAS